MSRHSLAAQVTPLVSQRGQGDARPARYGKKRCRCMRSTTAGNQSASWRAGPAGHPAPSAALRCALGPALSASGTGRTWCTTRAARRPGQPNGTWPGRCWPGRAVALRGIELVHSLGRRPSREHGRHHALWDWGHRNARSSAARISMRQLVWLLAVQSAGPGFLGDYRGVFPISQVGNQTLPNLSESSTSK